MDRRNLLFGVTGLALVALPALADSPAAPFRLTSTALYLPDYAMRERGPTVEALGDYINALVKQATETITGQPAQAGASGAIVMGLKPPAQSRMWLVLGDKTRHDGLAAILKGPLEGVPAPSVNGLNAFALNFDVWGGGRRSLSPIPLPDEWMTAMRAMKSPVLLPDAALRALWPN